jgi:hypothetical protein
LGGAGQVDPDEFFFPTEIAVATIEGQPVKTLVDRPLADDLPVDFDVASSTGSAVKGAACIITLS